MGKRKAMVDLNSQQGDNDVEVSDSSSKRTRQELQEQVQGRPKETSVSQSASGSKENIGSSGKRGRSQWDPWLEVDGEPIDGEGSGKRRRMRWVGDDALLKMLGPLQLPDFVKEPVVGADLDAVVRKLNMELLVINRKLRDSAMLGCQTKEARYQSPSPVYDKSRTLAVKFRRRLIQQRQWIISRLIQINPTFKPPTDYEPQKLYKKLYIPLREYPGYNFIGLIIGPRGNTQKRMERETGARILIRGKGSLKEGKSHLKRAIRSDPSESEDLHVLIEADNKTSLEAAVEMVEKLLAPVDEQLNQHKLSQLKELAELNVACKVCGEQGHRQHVCPSRTIFKADALCLVCCEYGHCKADCPLRASGRGSKMDNRYNSFLKQFRGGRSALGACHLPSSMPRQGTPELSTIPTYIAPCHAGLRPNTALESIPNKDIDDLNLYVAYLPQSVNDEQLIKLFSPFGKIISAKVMRDKTTGLSKGFGFVKYANHFSAAKAVEHMNGYKINRKTLLVRIAGRPPVASHALQSVGTAGVGLHLTSLATPSIQQENPDQPAWTSLPEPMLGGFHVAFPKNGALELSQSPAYLTPTEFCSRQLHSSCGSSFLQQTPIHLPSSCASQYQLYYATPNSNLSSQIHLTPPLQSNQMSCPWAAVHVTGKESRDVESSYEKIMSLPNPWSPPSYFATTN